MSVRTSAVLSGALFACALLAGSAAAQSVPDFLKKLPFPMPGPSPSAPAQKGNPPATQPAIAGLPVLQPNPQAQNELLPDRTCSRPQEKMNVFEKLADYGGQNAQARMRRLLQTDFKYSDLTPEDKAMLKYIAYTTVWIPAELETQIGQMYSSRSTDTSQAAGGAMKGAVDRAQQKMDSMLQQIPQFPGTPKLVVLSNLDNGATAQAGGLVTVGLPFLQVMDEEDGAGNLIIAHELSHLYKRHALKELQFQMISSGQGFEIARRLLRSFESSTAFFRDPLGTVKLGSDLVEYVRGTNVRFTREQELEADACAVVWMKKAGLDTRMTWQSFTKIATANRGEKYFESHPSNEERAQNLQGVGSQSAGTTKPAAPAMPASGTPATGTPATQPKPRG